MSGFATKPGRSSLVQAWSEAGGGAGPPGGVPGKRTLAEQSSGRAAPVAARPLGGAGGAPLPAALRRSYEGAAGVDLSGVRVHDGALAARAADAAGARAFTVGRDIFLGADAPAPGSPDGETLLGHEVAHTVQQRGGRPARGDRDRGDVGGAEAEADRFVAAIAGGAPVPRLTPGAVSIQRWANARMVQPVLRYIQQAAPDALPGILHHLEQAAGQAPAASAAAVMLELDGWQGPVVFEDLDELITRTRDRLEASRTAAPPGPNASRPDRTAGNESQIRAYIAALGDRAELMTIMERLSRCQGGDPEQLITLEIGGSWQVRRGAVPALLHAAEERHRQLVPPPPPQGPAVGTCAGHAVSEPGEPVPGDHRGDPSYIDNYVSGAYDLYTNVLTLGFADGSVEPLDYCDLANRRVDRVGAEPGERRVTLAVANRTRHGHLVPPAYNPETTPNLMHAVAAIEEARRERERGIIEGHASAAPSILATWGAAGPIRIRRGGAAPAEPNAATGGATRAPAGQTTQAGAAEPGGGGQVRGSTAEARGQSPGGARTAEAAGQSPGGARTAETAEQSPGGARTAETEGTTEAPGAGRRGGPDDEGSMAPGAGAPPAPELRPVEVTRQGDRVIVGWERYHGNLRRPRWLRVDGTSVHLRVNGDTVEVVMIYNVGDSGMSPTAMVAQACRTAGVPQPRILRGTRILAMQRSLAQYPVGTRFTGEQVESMNAGARYMAQALGARVQGGTVIDVPQGAAGAPSRSMELELAY
jgi:hypothetical protein